MVLPRYPTKGYLKVAELPDNTPDWFQGHQRFRYYPNDLPPLRNPNKGEVGVFNRWVESRQIERCTLTDLGAGGIKLGEPTIRGHEAEQTFGNTTQHYNHPPPNMTG